MRYWNVYDEPVYVSRYQPQGWGEPRTYGSCGCSGDRDCPRCDGTDQDAAELRTGRRPGVRYQPAEAVPPCMRETDEEVA